MNKYAIIDFKCKSENCDHKFNPENIQLVIHLHGIIFLIGSEEGFFGITCPKCLETHLYDKPIQELLAIYGILTSNVSVQKEGITENGSRTIENVLSFDSNLRYYSPFVMDDNAITCHEILHLSSSNSKYFFDTLYQYIIDEVSDVEKYFCSFVHDYCVKNYSPSLQAKPKEKNFITKIFHKLRLFSGSNSKTPIDPIPNYHFNKPAGMSSTIYWYKKDDILSLLKLEKEKGIRIFPRYYYYTDLHRKIDSLLGENYYLGKSFDQTLNDRQTDRTNVRQALKLYARENNINEENLLIQNNLMFKDPDTKEIHENKDLEYVIGQTQKRAHKNVLFTAHFLDILISAPSPLGSIMSKNFCNYLWSVRDPFFEKDFPDAFIDKLESDILNSKSEKMRTELDIMAARVRENITIESTQEYLKENLIGFLNKYKGLILSGQLSYSAIWELKKKYLKELFKATNIGLREKKSYTFHFVDPDWHIRFNGKLKVIPGKEHKGFKQVHFLLCDKNKSFNYFELDKVDGIDPTLCTFDKKHEFEKENENEIEKKKKKETFEVDEMMSDKGLASMKKEKKELKKELSDAEKADDLPWIEKAQQELDNFIEHLQTYYIPNTQTKRKFSDGNAKKTRERIEGNISRAIEKTKNYEPKLYLHFAKSIYGLSNKFYENAGLKKISIENFHVAYKPESDIDWHLD
jgi:hypothetical protein